MVLLHEDAGRVCYREWMKQLMPDALVTLRTNGTQSHFAAVEPGEPLAPFPRVVADPRPPPARHDTPLPHPLQPSPPRLPPAFLPPPPPPTPTHPPPPPL